MEKYELKFMYDWGSGVCVWSVNDAAKAKFHDYPIETANLPISQELISLLNKLIVQHDTALNWDDPGGELLWDKTRQVLFKEEAKSAYERLCTELGPDYKISFFPYVFEYEFSLIGGLHIGQPDLVSCEERGTYTDSGYAVPAER